MNSSDLWQRIEAFNQGRDTQRLTMKYQAMGKDSFAFLRGTNHLFYEDWPQNSSLNDVPLAWICGDLHLENFGSYRGDNRLTYFDVNDFDEAVLAPCTWDLTRFLCSVLVAAKNVGIEENLVIALCQNFLSNYSRELRECKPRWIERSIADGMIRDLLKNLKHRSYSDLLNEWTVKQDGKRLLKIDNRKAIEASPAEQQHIRSLIARFAETQPNPEFFSVHDVAKRIAGLGSLGLERYVVLINDSKHYYLLDVKYQPGSALVSYVSAPQPIWRNESERVVKLQQRSQAIAPAFLASIQDGNRSFFIKELMPSQDRLRLKNWNGKFRQLEQAVNSMAHLVAWMHVRSGGWQGSATADQWQAFGSRNDWQNAVLEYALNYSCQVQADWLKFKSANVPVVS